MKAFEAMPASAERFLLGEGPIWDGARGRLLWIDIDDGAVLVGRLDGDRVIVEDRLEFAGTVGAVTVGVDGRLLVAACRELVEVDAEGNRSRVLSLIADNEQRRLNDGKTDPAGRFLVGTCPTAERRQEEWLKRIEHDGSVTAIDTGLGLSNGLAWSCDDDPATGAVGERSAFVRIEDGYPDGMCTDAEDHLWIAVYGRGEVRRYSPDGNLVAVVRVAALQTTSVAFAGSGRDILVITTASRGLTPEELIEYPDSGRIFAARVDVQGAEVPPWVPVSSD